MNGHAARTVAALLCLAIVALPRQAHAAWRLFRSPNANAPAGAPGPAQAPPALPPALTPTAQAAEPDPVDRAIAVLAGTDAVNGPALTRLIHLSKEGAHAALARDLELGTVLLSGRTREVVLQGAQTARARALRTPLTDVAQASDDPSQDPLLIARARALVAEARGLAAVVRAREAAASADMLEWAVKERRGDDAAVLRARVGSLLVDRASGR